jgi:hypothetical protein
LFKIQIYGTEFSRDKEENAQEHRIINEEINSPEIKIRTQKLIYGPIIRI